MDREIPPLKLNPEDLISVERIQKTPIAGFEWFKHTDELTEKISGKILSLMNSPEAVYRVGRYIMPWDYRGTDKQLQYYLRKNERYNNLWDFTGGGLDGVLDDLINPKPTLERELEEETKLDRKTITRLGIQDFSRPEFWLINRKDPSLLLIYDPQMIYELPKQSSLIPILGEKMKKIWNRRSNKQTVGNDSCTK